MSPSFAPSSMNAAITSVYSVIAVCTPWIVVWRSLTICEIATFMTLVSSTITNWAEASMMRGIHLRIGDLRPMVARPRRVLPPAPRWSLSSDSFGPILGTEDARLRGGELAVGQTAAVVERGQPLEPLELGVFGSQGLRRAAIRVRRGHSLRGSSAEEGREAPAVCPLAGLGIGELAHYLAAKDLGADREQHDEEQNPDRLAQGCDRRPGDQGHEDDSGASVDGTSILAGVGRDLAAKRDRGSGRAREPGADHDEHPERD